MNAISVSELQSSFAQKSGPIVVDARPERDYRAAGETIAGALRRDGGRELVLLDPARCIGCAVCAVVCPFDAITRTGVGMPRRRPPYRFARSGVTIVAVEPVSTDRMSIVTATSARRASRSSVTVPLVWLKREIWVDRPRCS